MASCSSEVRCVSFGHDLSQNECTFSEVNLAKHLMACQDCTYYEKECNATINVSTASSIITDLTTLTSTETSSEHSMLISALYPSISSTNHINTLPTAVSTEKDITSDSTTSSTININTLPTTVSNQKDITSDSTTTVTEVSQYDTGSTPNNIYTLSSLDFSDISTKKDITSESYETSETTALQTLILETTAAGSTILVTREPVSPTAEKETTVLDSRSSMSTTQLLTTEADNSNVTSASTVFVNSSIFTFETTTFLNKTAQIFDRTCLCQCFYDNETTLRERMEVRKKYLEVNKRELSSFKRSLVCAADPRYSSTVTGSLLGVFVFTFIVLLVFVPDICSTVRHFIRKGKRGNLHVCKLKKNDKNL